MPQAGMRRAAQAPKRASGYTHYTSEELRLLAAWVEEGRTPTEIAGLLKRDVSSVARRIDRLAADAERAGGPSCFLV